MPFIGKRCYVCKKSPFLLLTKKPQPDRELHYVFTSQNTSGGVGVWRMVLHRVSVGFLRGKQSPTPLLLSRVGHGETGKLITWYNTANRSASQRLVSDGRVMLSAANSNTPAFFCLLPLSIPENIPILPVFLKRIFQQQQKPTNFSMSS
jgi:hypothetical protein